MSAAPYIPSVLLVALLGSAACGGGSSNAPAGESAGSTASPAAARSGPSTQVTLNGSPGLSSPPGTTVTWTASGKGGAAPYSFKWWLSNDGGRTWEPTQDWSTTPTWAWQPDRPGKFLISVWIRSAGQTADAREDATSSEFTVTQ